MGKIQSLGEGLKSLTIFIFSLAIWLITTKLILRTYFLGFQSPFSDSFSDFCVWLNKNYNNLYLLEIYFVWVMRHFSVPFLLFQLIIYFLHFYDHYIPAPMGLCNLPCYLSLCPVTSHPYTPLFLELRPLSQAY